MGDGNSMDAITKWMNSNPEAMNMGLGLLKGIEEDKRNKALSGAEIAKTQYGYLTGAGTGDISNLSMNNIGKRVQQGAMAGMIQRRDSDFNNKLLAALAAKKGKTPNREPASIVGMDEDQLDSKNEHHPILINPASQGRSIDDRAAEYAGNITGNRANVLAPIGYERQNYIERSPAMATPYTEQERVGAKDKRQKELEEYQRLLNMSSFGKY